MDPRDEWRGGGLSGPERAAEGARWVRCSRLGEVLPTIEARIGFVGALGARIQAEVSARAWAEWLPVQMKLINEYRLHLGRVDDQAFLAACATKFFRFDGGDGRLGRGPLGGALDASELKVP